MKDKINKFFGWVVSVNYYFYLIAGVAIGLSLHFSGLQISSDAQLIFLKNFGIPVVMYSLVVRLFCQIFYQEKYDEFPFRKIDHNMHIGIPRKDEIFYYLISESNLSSIRKFFGYLYAVSKPLVFVIYGMIIVSLLFVINNKI